MKIILISVFIISCTSVYCQNPVKWSFFSRKISSAEYELHFMAKIDVGWHIYSQTQPKDAIAVPTSIKFTKNPLMSLNGKLKEVGNLERHTEKTLGITQNQFSDTVDFVQVIKMNRKAKTNASGTIEFQVCTDEKCLPPKTIHFSIPIQ